MQEEEAPKQLLQVPNRASSQGRHSASKQSHLGFVDDEDSQMADQQEEQMSLEKADEIS